MEKFSVKNQPKIPGRNVVLGETLESLDLHWRNITKEALIAGIVECTPQWIASQFFRWDEYKFENEQALRDAGVAPDPQWEAELARFREIAFVQQFFKDTEFDCGLVDGLNGNNTRKGVKAFQEAWNKLNNDDRILVDGIIGNETIKRLGTLKEGLHNFAKAA